MFHIYKAHQIECLKEMKEFWDRLAKENGFDGIYLVAGNTAGVIKEETREIDAYYNFEPNHVWGQKRNKVFVKLLWWKAGLLRRAGKKKPETGIPPDLIGKVSYESNSLFGNLS